MMRCWFNIILYVLELNLKSKEDSETQLEVLAEQVHLRYEDELIYIRINHPH